MSEEEVAYTMCTGMLGRLYLSGHLPRMTAAQVGSVRAAVGAYRDIRADLATATPLWPLGLPDWTDPWLSLALRSGDSTYLGIWRRGAEAVTTLELAHLTGRQIDVEVLYPRHLTEWATIWDPDAGLLSVTSTGDGPAARILRIRPHGTPVAAA
jgi:alpha-galactosidase